MRMAKIRPTATPSAESHRSETRWTEAPDVDPLAGPHDGGRAPNDSHLAADLRLGVALHGKLAALVSDLLLRGELRRHAGQQLVVFVREIVERVV